MRMRTASRTALPILVAAILGALLCVDPPTRAQILGDSVSGWGLVMLHGKQSSPSTYNILGGALKANGATVATPLMAFGRSRMYDATYDHEAGIIDAAIDDLRARGFTKVALAGHSHGGGTALTYAVDRRRRLDALIIMAPGLTGEGPEIRVEEQRAVGLIAEGRGDVPTIFLDSNAGRGTTTHTNFYVTATPKIYLEWNTRRAKVWVDRAKAAKVPRGLPVLWIDGQLDLSLPRQRAAAMGLPKNPKDQYVELENTYHNDVPDESVSIVMEWFASLNN
jgi:pimeloyl-ACP methyl ester carboxylesterase